MPRHAAAPGRRCGAVHIVRADCLGVHHTMPGAPCARPDRRIRGWWCRMLLRGGAPPAHLAPPPRSTVAQDPPAAARSPRAGCGCAALDVRLPHQTSVSCASAEQPPSARGQPGSDHCVIVSSGSNLPPHGGNPSAPAPAQPACAGAARPPPANGLPPPLLRGEQIAIARCMLLRTAARYATPGRIVTCAAGGAKCCYAAARRPHTWPRRRAAP
jgi:hypothetical protein